MMFYDAALTERKETEHKLLINIQHASLKKPNQQRTSFFFFLFQLFWLSEIKMSAQPSLMCKPLWTRARKVVRVFSGSQSQSPKGFIRVVCIGRSLERAKRRSQSGISGRGHGRWVVPHGRHVSEPGGACARILFRLRLIKYRCHFSKCSYCHGASL